jgi:hypothetical protein
LTEISKPVYSNNVQAVSKSGILRPAWAQTYSARRNKNDGHCGGSQLKPHIAGSFLLTSNFLFNTRKIFSRLKPVGYAVFSSF